MVYRLVLIISILFISNKLYSQHEITEDRLISKFGQKGFENLNQKFINFFGKGIVVVEKGVRKEFDSLKFRFSYNYECLCQRLRMYRFRFTKESEEIIKVFPDFHKKPELKIQRYFMMKVIKHNFDLKEDLKKWPDLLDDVEVFKDKLALKNELPILYTLRNKQNLDGSYGEENKTYCSSMALLGLLSHGETTSSNKLWRNR